ncbi:MAG TPA: hypothetical protein VFC28_12360, partial [Opitutaceae bacterium]|nr:hypothetical protein [Opitutaceae bacterium]
MREIALHEPSLDSLPPIKDKDKEDPPAAASDPPTGTGVQSAGSRPASGEQAERAFFPAGGV